jgi:hypothetical protein
MHWSSHLVLAAALIQLVGGCKEYRIEHVKRPGFYQKASKEQLPDEITLDDGTIVKYESPDETSTLGLASKKDAKVFQPREETEDTGGKTKVVLRAILPEHVLLNTLNCLRNEEYQLLWEQGLSKRTKYNYAKSAEDQVGSGGDDKADRSNGEEQFTAFMQKYRHDLVATLTRMLTGISGQEVAIERIDDGVTRCRLRSQYVGTLVFTQIDMVKENGNLKLLLIHD